MKVLSLERTDEPDTFRALIFDIDEDPPHYKLLIDIFECDSAADAVHFALEAHPDTYYATDGKEVVQPDEISVGECARAMTGIW